MSSLQETDQASAAVAVAPRVSLADIESKIVAKAYTTGLEAVASQLDRDVNGEVNESFKALGLLTLCLLVTSNGFTIVGKSAPASPENFNADLGKKLAYEDAVRQLWPLYGFALREKLSSTLADAMAESGWSKRQIGAAMDAAGAAAP